MIYCTQCTVYVRKRSVGRIVFALYLVMLSRFYYFASFLLLPRWEEGLQIFVDMVKAAEAPRDPGTLAPMPPVPDATTYGAAITACSRGKQWQIALRLLEDMQERVRLDYLYPFSTTPTPTPALTPDANPNPNPIPDAVLRVPFVVRFSKRARSKRKYELYAPSTWEPESDLAPPGSYVLVNNVGVATYGNISQDMATYGNMCVGPFRHIFLFFLLVPAYLYLCLAGVSTVDRA